MIGHWSGPLPGGWLNPANILYDAGSSAYEWASGSSADAPPEVGPPEYTPIQAIEAPDVTVPRRVERPSAPRQSPVPGVAPDVARQDPYQTRVQLPGASRSGLPNWAPWAIGGGIFTLLVAIATGAVVVKRKRRRPARR